MLVMILKNDPCLYIQVMLVQCSVLHIYTSATLDTHKDGRHSSTLTSQREQISVTGRLRHRHAQRTNKQTL